MLQPRDKDTRYDGRNIEAKINMKDRFGRRAVSQAMVVPGDEV
jgi:hypothetical protein